MISNGNLWINFEWFYFLFSLTLIYDIMELLVAHIQKTFFLNAKL